MKYKKAMKDFENLTQEGQTNVIMQIGSKLTGQEVWYWEGIIHKLRESEQFVDSDMEIRKGLLDKIKRQQERTDKAIEYIKKHTYDDSIDGDGTRLMFEKANGYDLLNILQGSDKE